MRVVIVGAGEVGYHVIGALYREGVDIVAVDNDDGVLEQLRQEFNLTTIQGNAIDPSIFEQAKAADADLFIAVTNYDETNIIACMMASEAGVQKKIARVKTIDFRQQASFSDSKSLGIDLIINPYEVAAEHLANVINTPNVTDYSQFLDGRLLLLRIPLPANCPLVGQRVLDYGQSSGMKNSLIAVIRRDGNAFIPAATEVLQENDAVYFFVEKTQVKKLFQYLELRDKPPRRVFINGGGHIGYALAKRLEADHLDVRILEISEQRCMDLSRQLEDTLVLNVDGNDAKALRSEGVDHADFFISLTAADEINIVSCLQAKALGVRNTVALVKQPELIHPLMKNKGIDIAFSPRLLTARRILQFTRGRNLDSFYSFTSSDIELLELAVDTPMACTEKPLAELGLPPGILLGAVKRGKDIFVPRGGDQVRVGDTILLLQQRRNRRFTRTFFLEKQPIDGEPESSVVAPG